MHCVMFFCMLVVTILGWIGMNCDCVGWANLMIRTLQMVIVVTKFVSGSSYTLRILHLEGEKVFGSTKWMQDLSLWLEGNLYKHDCIIFFCPWMEFTSHNFTSNINVGYLNCSQEAFPIFIHNGEDVLEHLCGDDVWLIEQCPSNSNVQCLTLQKDTKHYCKVKII
jgi:hypothetical protein